MGHSDLDPTVHDRVLGGQNVGPKRALKPRDIWAIRFFLDEHWRLRDRALFDLAIDSKLRAFASRKGIRSRQGKGGIGGRATRTSLKCSIAWQPVAAFAGHKSGSSRSDLQ